MIARAGYYLGDLSCPLGPDSWRAILRSAHSAVAAAQHVCEPQHRCGPAYALCRPSGHHAHTDRAAGFCYVNNSAIAAETLLKRFGKVAVLDVDAHHGDGTQQIFYQRADVMTISLHADPSGYYPFYSGYAHERGYGAGYGYNLNFPLAHGTEDAGFRPRWTARSTPCATTARRPVLALGFDTYMHDPISVLRLGMDAYRGIGARINALGVPTVVVQEGVRGRRHRHGARCLPVRLHAGGGLKQRAGARSARPAQNHSRAPARRRIGAFADESADQRTAAVAVADGHNRIGAHAQGRQCARR